MKTINLSLFAILVTAVLLFTPEFTYAQHEGTLTKRNFSIGKCSVSSMNVKYKVGHFFGEPTVNGAFEWSGTSDCDLPYSTTIWLKIVHGSAYGYIRLSPTVSDEGKGYGFNVTGSPDWDEFICGFDGSKKKSCMDEESAKALYKSGRITEFKVGW